MNWWQCAALSMGLFAVSVSLLAWAIVSKAAVVQPEIARVTISGRVQVMLLRVLCPLIAGVDKSIGITKLPVRRFRLSIPTKYGTARSTIYRPQDSDTVSLPVHFSFHGGGFVAGYPQQDDRICRYLAHHARCAVVNVDYVLAPEHPYPAAILQCYEIVKWAVTSASTLSLDPTRLTVGGFSAGGTIAAALSCLARERMDFVISLQVMAYPALDFASRYEVVPDATARRSALTPGLMDFFTNLYVPRIADRNTPLVSPALMEDVQGLPPAVVVTAEHDLVRGGGNLYAAKLAAAGIEVTHREFLDCDHGFTHSGPKTQALEALDLMVEGLRAIFRR